MIKFYKDLFWGPKAAEKKKDIKWKLRFRKAMPGIHIVVLSPHDSDQLEIYELLQFIQPALKKKNLLIVGIGQGRTEALEVVRQIVEQTLQETGTANVKQFILTKSNNKYKGTVGE